MHPYQMMIDIEALGNGKDGLIVQIGACVFEPSAALAHGATFLQNVSIQSALDKGAQVEGKTIQWWLEQSAPAREGLFDPTPIKESRALEMLRGFYKEWCLAGPVWSHGSGYDLGHLKDAYARQGQKPPWSFRMERDTRTLFSLVDVVWPEHVGTKHNGLDDAVHQAKAVHACLKVVEKMKVLRVRG